MAQLTKNQNQPAGLDGLTKGDGTVVNAAPLDSGNVVTDPNNGTIVSHIGPPGG